MKPELDIEMLVNCPNEECDYLIHITVPIDLLKEEDTDGTLHDDGGYLLRQMFPSHGDHADFECDDVVCTKCKTKFNVRELEW